MPRKDGSRAVTAVLAGKSMRSLRYLAAGDYWFDEDQADSHDEINSRRHT
ncbi:hypothetical protein [Streptomyces sp. NBC_01207]